MEEIKLPPEISNKLIEIMLSTKEAQLLITGFVSGKEIKGKISLKADIIIQNEV